MATTSYPDTGWVLQDAFQDPRHLRTVFRRTFSAPDKTLLVGASLGGMIAIQQAERRAQDYDGALVFCPPAGGLDDAGAYHLNTALVFDAFFPGVLGLDPLNPPVAVDTDLVAATAAIALQSDPLATLQVFNVLAPELPGLPDPALAVESVVTSLVFWYGLGADLDDQANGNPFDTRDTIYAGSFDDAALNATIGRSVPDPQALAYADHWYEPTGSLGVPTIVTTTAADPVTPFFNTADLASKAAAEGAPLVVNTVDRYGHCAFDPSELLSSFQQLVLWTEFGLVPAGGDITAP